MNVKKISAKCQRDNGYLTKHNWENDPYAVQMLLENLSSSHSQQCRSQQEIVHDIQDQLFWHHLLSYLATHQWCNQAINFQLSDSLALERIDQAIIEVFMQEENNLEGNVKDAVLHKALHSREKHLHYAAAYVLGMRRDPKSVPVLADMIENGNMKWKVRAVKALATIRSEDCARPLMKVLFDDRGKLHREARRALQNLGVLAESVWLEALNHPDSYIRWEAACGLGEIGDSRAAATLVEGLFDESYVVRWVTVNVLVRLGEQGVSATLFALCNHTINDSSRQAAFHALNGCPSLEIRKRISPLFEALSGSSSEESIAIIARRLLIEWNQN